VFAPANGRRRVPQSSCTRPVPLICLCRLSRLHLWPRTQQQFSFRDIVFIILTPLSVGSGVCDQLVDVYSWQRLGQICCTNWWQGDCARSVFGKSQRLCVGGAWADDLEIRGTQGGSALPLGRSGHCNVDHRPLVAGYPHRPLVQKRGEAKPNGRGDTGQPPLRLKTAALGCSWRVQGRGRHAALFGVSPPCRAF